MAYIKVNHSQFSRTANDIDNYVNYMKRKMNEAQSEVNTMSSVWQGADYTQFKHRWSKVTNGESTYTEMINALQNYSKFLKYAEEKYKNTQAAAINRANGLPRW